MFVKATYIPSFLLDELKKQEQKDLAKVSALLKSISKIECTFENDEKLLQKVFTIIDKEQNRLSIVFLYRTASGKTTPNREAKAIAIWNKEAVKKLNLSQEDITFVKCVENTQVQPYIQNNIKEFDSFLEKQMQSTVGSMSSFCSAIAGASTSRCCETKYRIFESTIPLDELYNGLFAPAVHHAQKKAPAKPQINIQDILLEADKNRSNAETLDGLILSDPELGHWDLYWPDDVQAEQWYVKTLLKEKLCARNPVEDIQQHVPVAIDFGTTSTVVALREHGVERLLRIGVRDWRSLDPKDYENPTALEVLDFNAFMQAWQSLPYRPFTEWKHMKCSHAAKEDMQQSATCSVVQSGLTGLKTWANSGGKGVLRRRDQQKKDFSLQHLPMEYVEDATQTSLHENVHHFQSRDFDPIEVYAWFLGLSINNQLQGGGRIYNDYYLSFPIKFPKETRERILYSFKRGLERSLPPSLGLSQEWRKHSPLRVQEGASEPVAYAASALPALHLEPTEEGLAFGVFDFGGGTADFAVGLYRLSTAEEERDEGWEQVLELLDSSGDAYLGGEHLLHHMAYLVMEENITKLLDAGKGIPFTMPADAQLFTGAEVLMDNSLVAQTNTNKLCEMLRVLWEGKGFDQDTVAEGIIKVTLFDRDGNEIALVPLVIHVEKLENYLQQRILVGVEKFFSTFRQAFKRHNKRTATFHILLAGNSCRSPYVQQAFETMSQKILEDAYVPNEGIVLHSPLAQDTDSLFSLKTGVALGLLRTAPGESTGIIQREVMHSDETAFHFNVGPFKRNILNPVLNRYSEYNTWIPLGIVRNDLNLILGYSTNALALENTLPRQECHEKRFTFDAQHQGKALFIRALTPTSCELGIEEAVDSYTTLQAIHLDN